jgi:hypothetical protein
MTAMPSSVDRRRQRLLGRPSAFQATQDERMGDSLAFRPVFHAHGYAVMGQPTRYRSVSYLLSVCRPSYVSGLVVAVIVDAIERMIGRAATKIRKERGVIFPAFAHANASPSIAAEVMVSRAPAPIVHVLPCAPFTRARSMHRFAVPTIARKLQFSAPASTATRGIVEQAASPNFGDCSAFASTAPYRAVSASPDGLNDREPTESLARQVTSDRFGCNHAISSLREMVLARGWRAVNTPSNLANFIPAVAT